MVCPPHTCVYPHTETRHMHWVNAEDICQIAQQHMCKTWAVLEPPQTKRRRERPGLVVMLACDSSQGNETILKSVESMFVYESQNICDIEQQHMCKLCARAWKCVQHMCGQCKQNTLSTNKSFGVFAIDTHGKHVVFVLQLPHASCTCVAVQSAKCPLEMCATHVRPM